MKLAIFSRVMGERAVAPTVLSPDEMNCETTASSGKAEKVLVPTEEGEPSSDEEAPSETAAEGIKKVEAIAIVWSRSELYAAYAW
jgi:hypothetical protein